MATEATALANVAAKPPQTEFIISQPCLTPIISITLIKVFGDTPQPYFLLRKMKWKAHGNTSGVEIRLDLENAKTLAEDILKALA